MVWYGSLRRNDMSKFDDYIQPEDSAEMVIYEEYMAYVEEQNQIDRINWELLGVLVGCGQ
jgi:hypothetical protein